MDVEEQNIEDLFEDDDPADNSEEDPEMGDGPTDEVAGANLELGERSRAGEDESTLNDGGTSSAKEIKPKRKITKQPLLDANRVLGKRGVRILEKVFEDFEPRENNEFADLDIVVKRMKHWAHRMYPKLPFDDVTKQIANLGKKMQIQTNVKRIRLGLGVDPFFDRDITEKDTEDDPNQDNQRDQTAQDDVERYNDAPQEDVFEQLIREADERMAQQATTNDGAILIASQVQDENIPPIPAPNTRPSLTEEQKERMLKNRQLAEEKRRRRKESETAASLQIDSSSGNGLVKSPTDYNDAVTCIKDVDKGNEIELEINSQSKNMTPLTEMDELMPTEVMKVTSVDPNESLRVENVTVFSQDQTEKACSANGENTLATDFSEKATLAAESVDKAT